MKRILSSLIFLGCITFPVYAQTSGNTPPPPPYCTSANAGALYTNTGTSPATVYTCSYYNLAWQWVVNPSYGGLVSYPTVPTTCSGALPVFLAGWPNTQMYMCVRGVPLLIGGTGNAIGSFTYAGTSAPSATCSALVNNGYIATNATPQAYQCSNATGSYAWNMLGSNFSMALTPPIAGQYVFVPATSYSITHNDGSVYASNTSAFMILDGGGPFQITDTVVWSNFILPGYVIPANVTAVYAVAVSSQANYYLPLSYDFGGGPGEPMSTTLQCGISNLRSSAGGIKQSTALTALTGTTITGSTCTAQIAANYSGGGSLIVPQIGYLVYYTGTAPPANTNVIVAPPLTFNADSDTLALSIPFDTTVDTGSVNAYSVSLPWINLQPGTEIKVQIAYNSTSTTPTLSFNGSHAITIVGPTGSALASGDMIATIPAILMWNGTNWVLQNPQTASGSGSMSGMTTGQIPVAATASTVTSSKPLSGTGAGIATGPTTTTLNHCVKFGDTAGTLADAGAECGSGGGYTLPEATTTVLGGIKPDGSTCTTTAGVLTCTGGGGSGGVQYNPTTTAYRLISSSVLMDDNRALSSAVTAGAWSCSGTVCTVNTTGAHGYTTGDYIDATALTSWFSSSNKDTGVGVNAITVTSSTQFTFPYTANTGSGSGGSVYSANYWAAYQLANQPFLKDHGTLTQAFSTIANLDTNFSSMVNCSAGTPTYLILELSQNDLYDGASAATVEGHFQSVWNKAHTAGCIVIQGTILPTNFGFSDSDKLRGKVAMVNDWFTRQGKSYSGVSGGQYWDRFADFPVNLFDSSNYSCCTASGAHDFATTINAAFSAQEGILGNGVFNAQGDRSLSTGYNLTLTYNQPADMPYDSVIPRIVLDSNAHYGNEMMGVRDNYWSNPNRFSMGFDYNGNPTVWLHMGVGLAGGLYPATSYWVNGANTFVISAEYNATAHQWCDWAYSGVYLQTCTTGYSRYADGVLSADTTTAKDGLGSWRLYSIFATATVAPTGSCSTNGQWVPAVDGSLTRCLSGTWTAFSGGGGGGITLAQAKVQDTALDAVPGSPNAMDDEFTGESSFAGKWTESDSGTVSWSFPGSQTLFGAQSVAGGDFNSIVYQTAPSTTWEVTAKIKSFNNVVEDYHHAGIVLSDSTGKLVTWKLGTAASHAGVFSFVSDWWTNATTYSSAVSGCDTIGTAPPVPIGGFYYLRVKDDGTDLTFSYSLTGQNFVINCTQARTAYLSSGPTRVGLMIGNNNSTRDTGVNFGWFRRTL